ncbi:Sesquiterpene synthase, partial [Thalictrum thalictroides]
MAAAFTSGFMPHLLNVFGKPPSSRSAMNPRLVSYNQLPSASRSPITAGLKNVATKCSNATNASSDARPEFTRHFHPNVWDGHDFTFTSSKHLIDERRLKELKKEVKNMFSLAAGDSFRELDLIDKIQRHGVAYHFEDEIEHILQRTNNDDYTHFFDQNICKNEHHDLNLYYVSLRFRLLRQAGYYAVSTDVNLYYVSLRFRLLRQAGYYAVSTDVFKKFKNEK